MSSAQRCRLPLSPSSGQQPRPYGCRGRLAAGRGGGPEVTADRLWARRARRCLDAVGAAECGTAEPSQAEPRVFEGYWKWNGYNIRYKQAGQTGPAVVLVHGFGGNCDHWSKNIDGLCKSCKVYALDLLGYGYSDKPDPRKYERNSLYNFDNWAQQLLDFMENVVQERAFLICNSIGGIAGLHASVKGGTQVKGVQLLDLSHRLLHVKNQPALAKPFIWAFQELLYTTPLGEWFFSGIAKPESVKKILQRAYCDESTVTDDLVKNILDPGLQPGASRVFLDFITYSGGPLPRELLPKTKTPVSIVWGTDDPWEEIEKARDYQQYPCVEEFIELPGVGHCPHDEAPHLVNPLIEKFVQRHS